MRSETRRQGGRPAYSSNQGRSQKPKLSRQPGLPPTDRAYKCSKCHLVAWDRQRIPPPEISEIAGALDQGLPEWLACPKSGPRDMDLHDPSNPGNCRTRTWLEYGSIRGRICVPTYSVRTGTAVGGAPTRFISIQNSPDGEHRLQWYVEKLLEERGPSSDLDLDHLVPLRNLHFHGSQSLSQGSDGKWSLSHERDLVTMSNWFSEAARLADGLEPDELGRAHLAAEVLIRRVVVTPWEWKRRLKTTLFVPVDLRFSIDEQMARQRPTIREIQRALLRIAGAKEPMKLREDAARDQFMCYVLRVIKGLPYSIVAHRVYPGQPLKIAMMRAKKRVADARRQLGRPRAVRTGFGEEETP